MTTIDKRPNLDGYTDAITFGLMQLLAIARDAESRWSQDAPDAESQVAELLENAESEIDDLHELIELYEHARRVGE